MKKIFLLFITLVIDSITVFAQNQMVYVKGGTFQMGSPDGDKTAPLHIVTVSDFYISKYKVSLAEYGELTESWPFNYDNIWGNGETAKGTYSKDYNMVPAFGITWYEAIAYCNQLSVKEGLTPCYAANGSKDSVTYGSFFYKFNSDYESSCGLVIQGKITCDWNANGYRLPTEAEWEYAARGGIHNSEYKFAGSNMYKDVVNQTLPYKMGQKKANALGLYDMSMGPEWCWDLYSTTYYSKSKGTKDPHGPDKGDKIETYIASKGNVKKETRVQRGGYFGGDLTDRYATVYSRGKDIPERFEIAAGPIEYTFRLVRNAK